MNSSLNKHAPNARLSESKEPVPIFREVGGKASNLQKLFSFKQSNILNIYCTAGFPKLNSITEVLKALEQYGADIAEIGIPYSDPIADGPVIQHSNMIALQNGITIAKLFQQLKEFRNNNTSLARKNSFGGDSGLPLILMGYLNPVIQYGIERFCEHAAQAGVDGIILPDLPLYEFETQYQKAFQQNNLDFIFLITPETSEERIRKIDALSTGFIYAVTSSSTTGSSKNLQSQQAYLQRLKQMNLKNPVLAGFGINNKKTFQEACKYTNGAIIGSAYINALEKSTEINTATKQFLNEILT